MFISFSTIRNVHSPVKLYICCSLRGLLEISWRSPNVYRDVKYPKSRNVVSVEKYDHKSLLLVYLMLLNPHRPTNNYLV